MQFLVSGSILILPPYAEREKKPPEYCDCFCILLTAGIKPGMPAQQVSALSITPLPLGSRRPYKILLFP